jgi:hypothetical protein
MSFICDIGGNVAKSVRERAAEMGMKAMSKLFEDPKRAESIGKAISGLQQAKAALDEAQEKALKAAGLPTRDDFKSAGKRISALKRRCNELARDLDGLIASEKK